MIHPILRVVAFEIVATYSIRVRFDDGTSRLIDLEPVLAGELYGPLRDPTFFRAARIDPDSHTIVWPNGADFDPATLHDWPSHAEAFARSARAWSAGTRRPG